MYFDGAVLTTGDGAVLTIGDGAVLTRGRFDRTPICNQGRFVKTPFARPAEFENGTKFLRLAVEVAFKVVAFT